MKKALMISYAWPPMEGVGSIRAQKFAKFLPQFGWEVVILTAEREGAGHGAAVSNESGLKVYRSGYRDVIADIKSAFSVGSKGSSFVSKVKRFVREMVSMPDGEIGWRGFAVKAADKMLAKEKIDLVFSTSPPETAHLIARDLKMRRGLPWVADLRDLWADDHFRERPRIKKVILRFMERYVLKKADAVITVSEPWARRLGASINRTGHGIRVIENGFDEEDFSGASYGRNKKLIITYTGKLHKKRQDVELFFKALKALIDEGAVGRARIEARFHVMGYDRPDIAGLADRYGLKDVVKDAGVVPYKEALKIQRSSDALLFIQWQGRGDDGWYSAKLYDYIGARRPILAICRKDALAAQLIRSTSSGTISEDEEDLKRAIADIFREYMETGSVAYGGDEDRIGKYARRQMAEELAGVFDSIMERRKG